MTWYWRLALLAPALVVLAIAAAQVILAMPAFGHPLSQYGTTVNALGPMLRNVSNMVAAVNFDFRAIDTLGEESMLICAVTATVILLRGHRGEDMTECAGHLPGREWVERSDATVLLCRLMATVLFLYGVSVILHGTVTPGGGFQGGAIAASSLILIYLGEGYPVWRDVLHSETFAAVEGFGGLAFALAAMIPLAFGYAAAQNVLPLGTWKDLYSGGLMVIVNAAVGVAVIGSFGVLMLEFLEETRAPKAGGEDEEDEEDVE
ncbi:MAG TPA: MnhB domain-containing protein [Rhodanobacteraceae bacterium]|nr:MnhB domain-containing protein [Rhodanobacteraceae bacterium]